MWGKSNNNINLAIKDPLPLQSLREVEASVVTQVIQSGEQSGLVLYVDDNNYLKLVVEAMEDGKPYIIMAAEYKQSAKVFAQWGLTVPLADSANNVSCKLKLALSKVPDASSSEISVRAYVSNSEVDVSWTLVGECGLKDWLLLGDDTAESKVMVHPGVLVNGGVEGSGRESRVSDFSYIL
jgi:hypothetical protein